MSAHLDRLARRFSVAIRRSGKSQAEVALRAGISQSSLSRFLRRRLKSLRLDALLRLALELEVPAEELIPRTKPRRSA